MMLDYFSLKCFLTVAETRNITKSADIVGRTQSAVSQQITRLESLLGKLLFDRDKDMSLTDAGQLFLLYAKKISSLQHEALKQVQDIEIYKSIRLGVSSDLANLLIPNIFEKFNTAYPNVLLHMVSNNSLAILEQFEKKELDVCVVQEFADKLILKPVHSFKDDLIWVCKENFSFQIIERSLPLILSPSPSILTFKIINLLDECSLKYQIILSSFNFNIKIKAVESGLGVMVAPYSQINKNGKLDTLPQLPNVGKVTFSIYSLSRGPIENHLIEYILSVF